MCNVAASYLYFLISFYLFHSVEILFVTGSSISDGCQ